MATNVLPLDHRKQFIVRFLAHGLPRHMLTSLYQWLEFGQRPGDFLYCVLCNDFARAATFADSFNKRCLNQWLQFMHSADVPAACWGSIEKVNIWAAHRGRKGNQS